MLLQTASRVVPTALNIMRPSPSRLLIVSDEPKHLNILQSELGINGVEITNATTTEEVRRACASAHDLAVVDVAPGKVVDILETLRGSETHGDISVLVDTSRLLEDPSLAGVLPMFRAMPCNSDELVRLARSRVTAKKRRTSTIANSNKVL